MAQKLLKAGGKRKTAARRPAKKPEDGSVVLVEDLGKVCRMNGGRL